MDMNLTRLSACRLFMRREIDPATAFSALSSADVAAFDELGRTYKFRASPTSGKSRAERFYEHASRKALETATPLECEEAAREYIARRDRIRHPEGRLDNAKRWYPSGDDAEAFTGKVRSPSRAYPWSYNTACRSAAHVARLFGVPRQELLRAVRRIEAHEAAESAHEKLEAFDKHGPLASYA